MFKRIYWQVFLQKALDNRTMMIGHPAFSDWFHRLNQDGQELALLYLLLYVIDNTHSIQVEIILQKIIPANKNTSIYATTEQNNQFSVSRNIDENHTIPSGTIRLIDYICQNVSCQIDGNQGILFRVFQLTCCKAIVEASPQWRWWQKQAEKRLKCTHFANLRGLMPYS